MDVDEKRALVHKVADLHEWSTITDSCVCNWTGWNHAQHVAEAVLDALGLEPVGWWCPRHGDALCPEHYMLMADGTVALGYSMYWSENLRCGRREHTYRVAASGRVTEGKGTP